MKISWLPRYPEWGASSRMRVYAMHRELLRRGHRSVVGFDPEADVTVVQKSDDLDILHALGKAKGIRVYDFDDSPHAATALHAVHNLGVDLITTDTPHHAALLGNRPEARVIPDPIDYDPPCPQLPSDAPHGAVWFGFHENFRSVQGMVEGLHGAGAPVRIISNRDTPLEAYAAAKGMAFVPWELSTFIGELRKSTVAVLSHNGADPGKSANKMATAITWGLPCIVSDTPAYRDLATQAGVLLRSASLLPPFSELELFGRHSNFQQRKEYLEEAQPIVWNLYNVSAVVDQWLKMIEEVRR